MKVGDVPQDQGMIDGDRREICYAVDDAGRYVLSPSRGWEPKNVANQQAWELIRDEVEKTLTKIRNGKLSPLAYHMVRHQMNVGLLSKYVPYGWLQVWWHMRPKVFERLTPDTLKPYADLFELDVSILRTVPEMDQSE